MMDISPDQLSLVRRILARHVPGCRVLAFGSRTTGAAKRHSDFDLAVMASTRLPARRLARLKEEFSESRLPFKVDVVDWSAAGEAFRKIIRAHCEVVQAPKSGPTPG